jgi:acid phosphatase type 7
VAVRKYQGGWLPNTLAAFLIAVSIIFGCIAPALGAGPRITRGPYLQDLKPDSALVCWETDIAAAGGVAFGAVGQFGQSIDDAQSANRHCLRLVGLQPSARYQYQVKTNGQPISPIYSFSSFATSGQGNVRFAAVGDTRSNSVIHQQIADQIVQLAPDFVVNTGDLVAQGNNQAEWDNHFSIERQLMAQSPLYPVLGNHEQGTALYFRLFTLPGNGHWYSLDNGPLHITVLDAYSAFYPGSEQYMWLEADLQATSQPWRIVTLHDSPYVYSLAHPPNALARAYLAPLFEKYGVQLVIAGHNHFYQRSVVNGISYIVTGGGGAPLYGTTAGPGLQYSEAAFHFVVVTANSASLVTEGVRLDGTRFDTARLTLVGEEEPIFAYTEFPTPMMGRNAE